MNKVHIMKFGAIALTILTIFVMETNGHSIRLKRHSVAESGVNRRRRGLINDFKKLRIICEILERTYVPRVVEKGGNISEHREHHVMNAIRKALASNVKQINLPPIESYHLAMIDGNQVKSMLNGTDLSGVTIPPPSIEKQNSRMIQTRMREQIIDLCRRIHAILRKNDLSLRITCQM